ncbi:nuclear transport factor 2 family protein [Nakamurella leprariae]|uniref:Nuclear transport factor 2 family protein n=1 Tax=Nakamurella leprariae TaxID=2803911 RepID=A0A939BUY5_9ACTN|nr:nuclear transport factor 2 family protein [Nakamurella leprariae]MBM9465998.1 nuclear transport factor 2 family protein [Nakamurella leprariae]
MATIEELVRANLLEVFGERDADRRAAAAERVLAADVRFCDPEASVVGRDAVLAKAQQLLDDAPGFVFSPAGPVSVAQDLGHLAWEFGPPGAPPVARGIDIALVEDGLIARLWTMLLTE